MLHAQAQIDGPRLRLRRALVQKHGLLQERVLHWRGKNHCGRQQRHTERKRCLLPTGGASRLPTDSTTSEADNAAVSPDCGQVEHQLQQTSLSFSR